MKESVERSSGIPRQRIGAVRNRAIGLPANESLRTQDSGKSTTIRMGEKQKRLHIGQLSLMILTTAEEPVII